MAKEERAPIATTIPVDQHEALKALRWEVKAERLADLVREAIADYLVKHGKIKTEANGK